MTFDEICEATTALQQCQQRLIDVVVLMEANNVVSVNIPADAMKNVFTSTQSLEASLQEISSSLRKVFETSYN